MKLDRELQLEVLRALRESYPRSMTEVELPDVPWLQQNLWYLHELGLIDGEKFESFNGQFIGVTKVTAKGLDFLEDDGGLSAILGTITVRFDAEDLRTAMAARVEASELPVEEKRRVTHAIRSLPAQALGALTTRLVNAAVDRWPDALRLLQTYVTP